MKRKRLDRDLKTGWRFEGLPYYQMRVDIEDFHGLACVIKFTDGDYHYWGDDLRGKIAVCGKGMTWLQLIPDGKQRVITVKYLPDNSVSIWYVDIIDNIEYDTDGVAVFVDKYLDVIFTPKGDVHIDDRDELDDAYKSGELSKEQYDAALSECDTIVAELCSDIKQTEAFCSKILAYVNDRIKNGEKQFITKYDGVKLREF